ncbi:hypothetical protein U1Q18_027184 [Sarracenia purpurea var. burkii]
MVGFDVAQLMLCRIAAVLRSSWIAAVLFVLDLLDDFGLEVAEVGFHGSVDDGTGPSVAAALSGCSYASVFLSPTDPILLHLGAG